MNNSQKQNAAGKSIFLSSATGLANTLAVGATFFGTGPLYSLSIDWVEQFTRNHYGYAAADFTSLVWMAICACFIFFSARMSISTALTVGALSLATRLF